MRKPRISLFFLMALGFPGLFGCGGGGGRESGGDAATSTLSLSAANASEMNTAESCNGVEPMPETLFATWNETEVCTGLASTPPSVVFSPTVVCPRSGADSCLSTVPYFTCSDDPTKLCGAVGHFLPECNAIELPDKYTGSAAHEMIHYLLHQAGRDDWSKHTAAEFTCQ